jgi:FdrA protein
MIEPRMRHQRIAQEASDPETAVLLLDVVLGFGAHPDPAGGLVNLLRSVRETAAAEGRYLPVVTSVCGTEGDPQIRSEQVARLHEAGALVLRSNAAATLAAASIAKRELIQNG